MSKNMDQTLEGYTIDIIGREAAQSIDLPENRRDDVVGAAVGATSGFGVRRLTRALVYPGQEELYPDTYLSFNRTVLDGEYGCFREQDCDWLETRNQLSSSYPLGLTVDSVYQAQYRWVEIEAGTASVYRTWMTQPADVSFDWMQIPEQFYLGVNLPRRGGGTVRLMATWILAEIGNSDVPENVALNMVIDSMVTSNDEIGDWMRAN